MVLLVWFVRNVVICELLPFESSKTSPNNSCFLRFCEPVKSQNKYVSAEHTPRVRIVEVFYESSNLRTCRMESHKRLLGSIDSSKMLKILLGAVSIRTYLFTVYFLLISLFQPLMHEK